MYPSSIYFGPKVPKKSDYFKALRYILFEHMDL